MEEYDSVGSRGRIWGRRAYDSPSRRSSERPITEAGENVLAALTELFQSGAVEALLQAQDVIHNRGGKETAFSVRAWCDLPSDDYRAVIRELRSTGVLDPETERSVGYVMQLVPTVQRQGDEAFSADPFGFHAGSYPLARATLDYNIREPLTVGGQKTRDTLRGFVVQTSETGLRVFRYAYAGGVWASTQPLQTQNKGVEGVLTSLEEVDRAQFAMRLNG